MWPFILGGVVLLLVGLGVLGAVVGDDEDEPDTAVPVEVTAASGPTVVSGAVSLTLPRGWIGADMAGAPGDVGTLLFPNEPEIAERIGQLVSFLPNAVLLVGIDEAGVRGGSAFVANTNVLLDPSVPSGMDLDEVLEAQVRGFEAFAAGEVSDADLVLIGGREVGRIQAELNGIGLLSYIVPAGDATYVVSFSFDDVDDDAIALADGSVLTFVAG